MKSITFYNSEQSVSVNNSKTQLPHHYRLLQPLLICDMLQPPHCLGSCLLDLSYSVQNWTLLWICALTSARWRGIISSCDLLVCSCQHSPEHGHHLFLPGCSADCCATCCSPGPPVLFHRAAPERVCPQAVLFPGLSLSQVQDYADLHEVFISPFPQVVKVSLNGTPTSNAVTIPLVWCHPHPVSEGAVLPLILAVDEDAKRYEPQYQSLKTRVILS